MGTDGTAVRDRSSGNFFYDGGHLAVTSPPCAHVGTKSVIDFLDSVFALVIFLPLSARLYCIQRRNSVNKSIFFLFCYSSHTIHGVKNGLRALKVQYEESECKE